MEKKTFKRSLLLGILFVFICAPINSPWAAEKKFPSRYIEIYHGFTPGAALDAQCRFLAQALEKHLGVNVITVAKPGGGGVVGTTALINSAPDGYTLAYMGFNNICQTILASNGTFTLEDIKVVAQASIFGAGMGVPIDSQWKTIQELIDFARKNPGLKFGHPGVASSVYLRTENLNRNANLKMVGVPFRGDSEVVAAILGKHVPLGVLSALSSKAQSEAGKMRILLSFDGPPAKFGLDPNIPCIATTFDKSVVDKDIEMVVFVIAPRKTPDEVVKVLENALEKVCKEPELMNSAIKTGMAIDFRDSKTATQYLYRIMERVKAIQQ
jgi:tripartite-type tricarboxylate transporter receptor subunit TctC